MMKKVFSFLLAVAVIATSISSVFAAVSIIDGGDGNTLIDDSTVPAKSYYSTVVPSTNIVATKLTSKAEVKAASTTAISNNANYNVANYDVYKIDITVSNMGEIVNGYNEGWEPVYAGVYGVAVSFPTTAFINKYIKNDQIAGGSAGAGQDGDTFNVTWAAGAVDNPYPYFDGDADPSVAQYQANGSMTISLVVTTTKDSTVNVSNIATAVTYVGYNFTGGSYGNTSAAAQSLSLGSVTKVQNVAFDNATLSLTAGGSTATITATVTPNEAADKSLTWSTSDANVATVANGVVTPVAAGTATITATANDGSGKYATCAVTVAAPLPAPVNSTGFKKIDNGTALKNLKGVDVDASANYGVGRIDTTVDTANYYYKVVASDYDDEKITKEWDAPISGAELTGTINFIAIVKSATHKIGNIWLQAYSK